MAAADIDDVKSAIDDVDSEIEIEQRRIEHAEKQMETADPGDRRFLQEVKIKLLESANVLKSQKKVLLEHLRDAKNLLREEKILLLKKETQPERRRAPDNFRDFVLSAANNYREWEQGTAMAAEHAAKKPKVMSKKSLKVSADPLGNYGGGILILVRKAYTDLKQIILDEAKERKRRKFIVLGTAGIGKSYFLVFFICYLATQKIKVVWKFSNGDHYLLDFTQDVAEALGPFRDSSTRVLREVFNDLKGWLIIDGQQTTRLPYRCQVLLACCAERDNYYEFSKSDDCKKFYCPVWTEEEIGEFCDDFGEHGSKFPKMCVPDKEEARRRFEELGGVPRYVLTQDSEKGLQLCNEALESLDTKSCLSLHKGNFHVDLAFKDSLLHIKTDETYATMKYDFASKAMREVVGRYL